MLVGDSSTVVGCEVYLLSSSIGNLVLWISGMGRERTYKEYGSKGRVWEMDRGLYITRKSPSSDR